MQWGMVADGGMMFAAGNAGAPYGRTQPIVRTREMAPKMEQKPTPNQMSYVSTSTGRVNFEKANETGSINFNPTISSKEGLSVGYIDLFPSVQSVMGTNYSTVSEVTTQIKIQSLLSALNEKMAGDWVKVYEAGILNGNKIETHYFRNNNTGNVFDVKIKYDYWHQKSFKKLN